MRFKDTHNTTGLVLTAMTFRRFLNIHTQDCTFKEDIRNLSAPYCMGVLSNIFRQQRHFVAWDGEGDSIETLNIGILDHLIIGSKGHRVRLIGQ